MIKTMILGGSGYIGKNIASQLNQHDHQIIPLGRQQIDLEATDAGQQLVRILKKLRPDNLIICSAITRTKENNADTCFRNIIQLRAIVSALTGVSVKHVIYLSAADVYGHAGALVSEHTTLHPQNEYGAFKVFAEHLLRVTVADCCPFTVLRFSGVFGGQDDSTSLVQRFSQYIRAETPIVLSNRGANLRDFLPVTFLATVVRTVLDSQSAGIFNVSTGEQLTIAMLVKFIEKALSKPAILTIKDTQTDRDFDLSLSNEKLTQTFSDLAIPRVENAITDFVQGVGS